MVFAGLVAAPVAAFADGAPGLPGVPSDAYTVVPDPDSAGYLYQLTADVRTFKTITMPDDATLDGAGHTITAVEDAEHRNFPGPVLVSATGDATAPATLDVKNLTIATEDFEHGSNSNGLLTGISMYRADGSLTDVTVDGISHGNGVQEGNAIAIRNRVDADNLNVPRAHVDLTNVQVSRYQKTGVLLDGNLMFTVTDATVGQGSGPEDQPNPGIAANSLQISRGASGTVSDSTFALNSHVQATAVLLFNAKTVEFDGVTVSGDAAATTGIDVSNSNTPIDTTFTMRGGAITRTATPADGTGLVIDGPENAITAKTVDTPITGWSTPTSGSVDVTTSPEPPVVTDVDGTYQASRPHPRRLRINLQAFELGANQVEGNQLKWRFRVDGHGAGAIREHAGETDVWSQRFEKGTGRHTVEVLKNGVSQHVYKVDAR